MGGLEDAVLTADFGGFEPSIDFLDLEGKCQTVGLLTAAMAEPFQDVKMWPQAPQD